MVEGITWKEQMLRPPVTNLSSGALSTLVTFFVVVWLIQIFSYWKVFTKAGQSGWLAVIPIFNLVILTRIAKYSGWLALIFFFPLVNIAWIFIVNISVAKAFGKRAGFGVLMAFLPIVGYPILGFGDAKYEANP